MKVTRITVETEDGRVITYKGIGEVREVHTQTKDDELSQPKWPKVHFVTAHLVIEAS